MSNSNHSTSYSQYARNSTYSIETTRTHPEAFYVRSTYYDIIFVNNNTSMDILNKLLIHMNAGNQYSIDTNSDRRNNLSALIQINTMPIEEKSVVILFELNHFPDLSSTRYEIIISLFRVTFREGNEIYSWGDMKLELQQARRLLT
ncbi:unnamed protein product [Adineta steineri]|uniref:Uncharacterized protein n=1 Tax=Adineta steineri TaxID=433720 RepID=A0A819U276_9BILA|nr:unnamed protein product [Adineta steineri]CAF4084619.1 unnamed protein product [Adineta steineri]